MTAKNILVILFSVILNHGYAFLATPRVSFGTFLGVAGVSVRFLFNRTEVPRILISKGQI